MLESRWQYSIEKTLPLLVSGLLLLIILTFSWATYREVRRVSVVAADERLERVVQQIAVAIERAIRLRVERVEAVAQEPSVVELLQRLRLPGAQMTVWSQRSSPERGGEPVEEEVAARDALLRLLDSESQIVSVVLVDRDGRVVGEVGRMRGQPLDLSHISSEDAVAPTTGFVGLLRRFEDTLYYDVWAPVLEDETVSGWIGMRRVVGANRTARELIEALIGPEAVFFVGNEDGSVWTDLEQVMPGPPQELLAADASIRYQRSGEQRLGRVAALEGVAWQVVVELPHSAVLAPARAMMWPLAALTAVVVVIAVLGARTVSRQITEPLRQATEAAEGIASGDHSRRVTEVHDDKLGTLARAFNEMAEEVGRSQDALEEQVAERSARLQRTAVELNETRDELVQMEKLALFDQLSSGIGHELRNPLGVIRNCAFVLQAALPDASADTRRYLHVIDQQVRSADRIIEELLAFGRVRPAQTSEFAIVDALAAAAEAVPALSATTVRHAIPPDLPDVCADREQVDEILTKVFENAALAMPGGGTLTLSAELQAPSTVVVRIEDTGSGIAAELRHRVFEPLYTTRARGIGLGLSVARNLARNNRGDLSVDLTDGGGATLVLRLPAAQP